MLNSYLDLYFDVLHTVTGSRYADKVDITLVKICPSALFSSYKLTTSSGKHLKDINLADIVCLMYTLKTTAKDSDELSIGFDRDRVRRQRELTNNRDIKGKNRVRILH